MLFYNALTYGGRGHNRSISVGVHDNAGDEDEDGYNIGLW